MCKDFENSIIRMFNMWLAEAIFVRSPSMNCRGRSGLKPCSPAIVVGLENYSLFETPAICVIHHEPVDKLATFTSLIRSVYQSFLWRSGWSARRFSQINLCTHFSYMEFIFHVHGSLLHFSVPHWLHVSFFVTFTILKEMIMPIFVW